MLWLGHCAVQQTLTQHCKSTVLYEKQKKFVFLWTSFVCVWNFPPYLLPVCTVGLPSTRKSQYIMPFALPMIIRNTCVLEQRKQRCKVAHLEQVEPWQSRGSGDLGALSCSAPWSLVCLPKPLSLWVEAKRPLCHNEVKIDSTLH